MQSKAENRGTTKELHLRDYWKVVWQGRYTALVVFSVVLGITALRVVLATPVYEASAVLRIDPEAKRILPGQEQWVGAQGGGWISEEKYFNTQIEVLKSRDLAERTFRRLHLEKNPAFAEAADPVARFASLIEVRPKNDTRLVAVAMTGTDPKEVEDWVNALADTYVRRNVEQAVSSFRGILDEIDRGLATSRESIGRTDTERMRQAAVKDLYVPENQQEVLKRNLQTYNDELAGTRKTIGSIGSELAALDRIRETGGDYMTLPTVSKDLVLQQLNTDRVAAERELQKIASEKRPTHPDYVAKRQDIEKIRDRIEEQIRTIAEKLRTDYRIAKSNETYLENQIRSVQEQTYHVQEANSSLEMLKTDAESKRKVYDVVAETMERLTLGAQLIALNNNVSIQDRAITPRAPVRPRKLLALALGSFFGFVLGLGTVLFLDYLDNTIRSPEDVEQHLGLSVLAVVPKMRDGTANAVKEAYQSLRTSLLFSSQNRERNVMLFSSAGPQEGKSSTVAAVAKTLASAGDRVIVLDADLRRPTQHAQLGLRREPGITNFLVEGKDDNYTPYLSDTELPTLKVLTCGPIPPNPPDLIGSAKFRRLVEKLKHDFDWVLMDSPPVVSLADTVVLATMSDLVAVVIKHNENDRDLILRCVKHLRDVNANIIGAVLNNVDIDRAYYKDYYYAGYYHYSEGAEERGRRRNRPGKSADPSRDRIAL